MANENSSMSHSCPICLEEFKTPKVLSCGHTFCLPCINKIIDREEGRKPALQCPICKVPVSFPDSGAAEDLATNFQLLSLLKITKQEIQAGSHGEEGGEEVREEVKGQSRCDLHGLENQLYCEVCKTPVCTRCIFHEHKVGDHNVITKEDFIGEQTAQLNTLTEKLDAVSGVCVKVATELANHRSAYLDDKQKLEETIEANLKEKQERLDQSAKSLLEQVHESSGKPEELYTNLTNQISLRQELIDSLQTGTRNLRDELEAKRFTQESDLVEIDKFIDGLMPELAALGKACNSVPRKTSLTFTVSNSNTHLGTLTSSGSVSNRLKSKKTAWFGEKGSNQSNLKAAHQFSQSTTELSSTV